MIMRKPGSGRDGERGAALGLVLLSVAAMGGMSAALLLVHMASSREQRGELVETRARYVCQAGLTQAMYQMSRGESGDVASSQSPAVWGSSRFWVTEDSLGGDLFQVRATGLEDRAGASMELIVREVPDTIWRYGAFGREFLHMDSNSRVDSYDSTLGTYASQAVNGSGASAWANANGDVGSNGDVSLDSNARVYGDATAGPDHYTTVTGNAVVSGSTSPTTAQVEFPAILVPTYPSFGSVTFNANATLPSSNRTYGNFRVGANRTVTINGPASFVVTNLILNSGSSIVVNASAGPVDFIVLDDFVMNSNSSIHSTDNDPLDIRLQLLSDNVINPEITIQLDEVDFNSNTQLYGTIYAPTAAITFDSNFELFGAILARSLDIDSNSRIHFDEALIDATASGESHFETVCWRDIPLQH
jgi:hypothetical protein